MAPRQPKSDPPSHVPEHSSDLQPQTCVCSEWKSSTHLGWLRSSGLPLPTHGTAYPRSHGSPGCLGKSLRMLSAQAWPRLFISELCYPYCKVCKWAVNHTERILTLLHSYKEKNPIIIVPHQFQAHMFLWFSSKPQAWSVGITGKV